MDITVHPVYSQLLKFLNNSNAREKLLRFLQYFVRTLNAKGFPLKSLQSQLMLARKPLRAFKGLTHLRNVVKLIKDEIMDPCLKWFTILKELALGLYFTLDTFQYLQLLNLWNGPKEIKRWGGITWSIGLTMSLLGCLRQWHMYPSQKDIKGQVSKLQRETIKTLLDLPIALSQVEPLGFKEETLGSFGVITSYMALEDLWRSSK